MESGRAGQSETSEPAAVETSSVRTAFSDLLREALVAVQVETGPSPMAVAYLLELLERQLRSPEPAGAMAPDLAPSLGLGEALLEARRDEGHPRRRQLRALGDRALFVAGVFGDSLRKSAVDLDYYTEVGCEAYSELSELLVAQNRREAPWRVLFRELADGFGDFVDVLAEVGQSTRPGYQPDTERLLERFTVTGSDRDGRLLLERGVLLATEATSSRTQ